MPIREGRVDWAEFIPGHSGKQGYAGAPSPPGGPKTGVVYHSAEGYASALRRLVQDWDRRASWHFSILLDGTLWQHYAVEAHCWHAGDVSRLNDVDSQGALAANLDLVGVEFEGVAGYPITDNQVMTGARLYRELSEYFGFGPMSRTGVWPKKTMWEHREITTTSCPSGRIRWDDIMALINSGKATEEPSISQEELLRLYRGQVRAIRSVIRYVWLAKWGEPVPDELRESR